MILEYKTLFPCDPGKNKECSKSSCYINGGSCYQTNKLKYAKMTHPSDYGMCQRKQTADIYARIKIDAPAK